MNSITVHQLGLELDLFAIDYQPKMELKQWSKQLFGPMDHYQLSKFLVGHNVSLSHF